MIEVGTIYYGAHRERRLVTAVSDTMVAFIYPLSGTRETVSLSEFEAWQVGEYVDPFA